jgi:predicted small lipoprotein YifL
MKLLFSTLTSLVAGLFLLTGCAGMVHGHARAIRLKIVDAKTGDPVPGVSAVWREDQDDMLYGTSHLGPMDLPPSDNNGAITITAAHEKMDGRFILAHLGYVTLYGVYSGGTLNVSREIQPPPFPQDIFVLDDAQTIGQNTDGTFVIRMPK